MTKGAPHMNTNRGSQTLLDIRRSHQRFHTQISWLDSHHSFSFSDHYAPDNTHHGLLLVSNDDVVKPNTGFRPHPPQCPRVSLEGERKRRETVMKKVTKAGRLLTLGWLAAIFFGCGILQSQPVSRIVPISGFDQVASNWEGLSKRVPDMRDHARVILIISEKGFFHFASNRATGLLLGTGTLHIHDGEVFGKTGNGSATFTLHDKAGKRVLVVEAVLNDGNHYYLEMTPIK